MLFLPIALAIATVDSPTVTPIQETAEQQPRPPQPLAAGNVGSYEGQYGKPMYWSLHEILYGEAPPSGRSIWTHGVFVVAADGARLCPPEGDASCLSLISPVPEIAEPFFFQVPSRQGDEAKVVGVFIDRETQAESPTHPRDDKGAHGRVAMPAAASTARDFTFWSFESGPPLKGPGSRRGSSLESLVTSPRRFEGRTVTVRGRFRGGNLFSDLAPGSQRRTSDWVLRDGPFSVWVTGREATGRGWRLDPASLGDTRWLVEVEARVEQEGGLVFLVARNVRLVERENDQHQP